MKKITTKKELHEFIDSIGDKKFTMKRWLDTTSHQPTIGVKVDGEEEVCYTMSLALECKDELEDKVNALQSNQLH